MLMEHFQCARYMENTEKAHSSHQGVHSSLRRRYDSLEVKQRQRSSQPR